jgi:hypothetical protein
MQMSKKCCVKGCDREWVVKKHQLCRTHYMRYRNKGDPGDGRIVPKTPIKPYLKAMMIVK